MELVQCKSNLREAVMNNPSLAAKGEKGFRDLLKKAWSGEDFMDCYKKFQEIGGTEEIKTIIENTSVANMHGVADNEYVEIEDSELVGMEGKDPQQNPDKQTQTTQEVEQDTGFLGVDFGQIKTFFRYSFLIIITLVAIIFFWKLIRYVIAFFYDVFNAKRMVFLRIIVPRGDSKFDREREKEIAKDMKEKISRMAQVYRNMHKLGELNVVDNLMKWLFQKPKIVLIMHYEKGMMNTILGVYPEYKNIIEGAVAAQYPDASIETVKFPKIFKHPHNEIIPLEPFKDTIYPIRTFKQLEDDPMNNVVDAMGKISGEDTMSIMLTIKPEGEKFNKRAQKYANALYKKDDAITKKRPLWKKILMPWTIFDFLIHGPSDGLIKKFTAPGANSGDPFIRMVKAEEEALNEMGEEAGKPAFKSGLLLITTSKKKKRLDGNLHTIISAYNIYTDEYNNGLDQPETVADLLGWLLKPLWRFSAWFCLPHFFYRKNTFTVNELASLVHLPDGLYNRSPIIKWMDYKVLPAPDNLPELKDDSGFRITGKIAEEYMDGDISNLFAKEDNRYVGTKKSEQKRYEPVEKFTQEQLQGKTIVERNDDKFVEFTDYEEKTGLKVFNDGTLLGVNVYRNQYKPVYMKKKDRSRHHYIIGKSGGGKSVFIASLARQDVWTNNGVCVMDPHGDLVEDVLAYVPKERARDVIYFDAGNEDRPMGMNLYEIDSIDEADRVVNDATEIFLKMFGPEIFGPRIQEYFKYGSLTLLEDLEDGATLIDVPRIFTDEVFREYKIRKVRNPIVRNFWERTYNAMGDREKQEIIPYFTSKFVSFTTNRLIRNIIGQTKSAIKFREAMDEGKILLVNLSKGKIGELNSQLLGMIVVAQINNAAMSRADVPEEQRRDFYLYVDEFQNYVSGTFADILSEARKYHLSLIMAHQYIAQLEGDNGGYENKGGKNSVKDAVFGNVGTMQSFKVGAPDAEFLEKEYAPVLSAQDIIGISNFKVYIKLNINNASSRVFSMNTIWTKDYENLKVADIMREYSGKKYGRKREFVEAEISARMGMLEDEDENNDESQLQDQAQNQEQLQIG